MTHCSQLQRADPAPSNPLPALTTFIFGPSRTVGSTVLTSGTPHLPKHPLAHRNAPCWRGLCTALDLDTLVCTPFCQVTNLAGSLTPFPCNGRQDLAALARRSTSLVHLVGILAILRMQHSGGAPWPRATIRSQNEEQHMPLAPANVSSS